MAYSKTNWMNGGPPAISADNLNKIENELERLSSLMDQLSAKIQYGTVTNESLAANGVRTVDIVFPTRMNSVPVVVCGLMTNSTAGGFGSITAAVVKDSVTATGFKCRIHNGDTSSRIPGAYWIAVAL